MCGKEYIHDFSNCNVFHTSAQIFNNKHNSSNNKNIKDDDVE
jgi:hypothetical protein